MKQQQGGFTLIELVMVIVILGVLAAVAIPKFVDLQADARTASIQGAAGALSSASAVNYAAAMARGTTGANVVALSASNAASLMIAGIPSWDSTKFSVGTEANCAASTAGAAAKATLIYATSAGGTATNSAVATVICTG